MKNKATEPPYEKYLCRPMNVFIMTFNRYLLTSNYYITSWIQVSKNLTRNYKYASKKLYYQLQRNQLLESSKQNYFSDNV